MRELDRDIVFRALTRPQMFAGVTYSFFVLNAVAVIELFLITRSFWVIPLGVAIHFAGALACVGEPRLFDLWIIKVSRCPRVRNARFWGCNSYAP